MEQWCQLWRDAYRHAVITIELNGPIFLPTLNEPNWCIKHEKHKIRGRTMLSMVFEESLVNQAFEENLKVAAVLPT